MAFIRITKIFNFEMAHLLQNHKGLCRNIHGHSYVLHVCVGGSPLKCSGSPQDGMVLDFADLKKMVQEKIIEEFDHCLLINSNSYERIGSMLDPLKIKIVCLPFEPTSENMIVYFSEKLINQLPPSLKLVSLRLYETATSYAEWMADDN